MQLSTIRIPKKLNIPFVFLALTFLASMNFFAKFNYIVFIAFFIVVLPRLKFKADAGVYPLLLLSVCLLLTGSDQTFNEALKNFSIPLFYLCGLNLVSFDDLDKMEKLFEKVVFAITLGLTTHTLLNMYINLQTGNLANRNTIDFWTRDILSATGQSAFGCICIGYAIAAFLSSTKRKTKVYAIIISLIAAVYNFVLACRTPILMAAIILLVGIVFMLASREKAGLKIKVLLGLTIATIVILLLYSANVGGIRTYVESSNLFLRVFGANNLGLKSARIDARIFYMKEIWNYPLGGSNLMETYGYAHDILLDTFDKAGAVAAICVIASLVQSARLVIKTIKHPNISFHFKQLVLCVYLACFMEFFIEPIMYGMTWLFVLFCMLNGMLQSMLKMQKRVDL